MVYNIDSSGVTMKGERALSYVTPNLELPQTDPILWWFKYVAHLLRFLQNYYFNS